MEIYEYIVQSLFILVFLSLFIVTIIYAWMVFKSEKYLAVKELEKQVQIARADLKFEYKMAVLNYKSNQNTRHKKRNEERAKYNYLKCLGYSRDVCKKRSKWTYERIQVQHEQINKVHIIDDNNYLNGVYTEFTPELPYIIITGERAIGKSQFSKVMSTWNRGIQYYSVQRLIDVSLEFRTRAEKVLIIRDIEDLEKRYPKE